MVLSALRYAMGRHTYITSLTSDFIRRHWKSINPQNQYNIHRDLKEFLEHDTDTSTINMIDHEAWQNLLAWIKNERKDSSWQP